MELIPAVDLYGGNVVRLTEGRFERATIYPLDLSSLGERFLRDGAQWVHVVDLEGAKMGEPKHLKALRALKSLGLKVQFGGGLRSVDWCLRALDAGADRVMVGSALFDASKAPEDFSKALGEALVAAVDHRGGKVCVRGWTQETDITVDRALEDLSAQGVSLFLVTCAERDGTLEGPDLNTYSRICQRHQVIAAGGIRDPKDLKALKACGAVGAVAGKALYEGGLDIREAMEVLKWG
ncbi:MAG: 1-(5-phosphoribosyl)-5-[(5-phosphoribosylamino)methylideneamino] imidazole-4-carboxamide isomerase [Thermanaerothrix sp.]|nr:1-(5-phosphoribosyl)-5-[(5-phosphoribosylamino)methylideneamino] imidazole-4-carboxamide isomerase [Thermanaerothrix sp.]